MINNVENCAPAAAIVRITTDDSEVITIERDDSNRVSITITDSEEGYEQRLILGEESETTLL